MIMSSRADADFAATSDSADECAAVLCLQAAFSPQRPGPGCLSGRLRSVVSTEFEEVRNERGCGGHALSNGRGFEMRVG